MAAAVSILSVLAVLPDGGRGANLTFDELGTYLREHCNTEAHKDREKRHALRDELYRDGGTGALSTLLGVVFDDPDTRRLRQRWVKYARFSNPTKRIVRQLSTIYQEPAERFIDKAGAVKFEALCKAIKLDAQLLEASRLLNLHFAIAMGLHVREKSDGTREPVLDIATPSTFRPVLHPNDAKLVIGWLVRTSYRRVARIGGMETPPLPVWTLWTDYERVQLREDFSPIGSTYKIHELGVCPWFGIALGPDQPGFFAPGEEGEDRTSAHVAILVAHTLLLKETKSATKTAAITGEGTTTARGQGLDTEFPTELSEGQSVTVHDLSMDLAMFQGVADHVLTHVALNSEIPPAMLTHQGAQSAEARDLLRLPIKELRKQQAITWQDCEHHLFGVVAPAVLKVELPTMHFEPTGFRVRHVESETPLDPMTEHDLFVKRRGAGLDNSIAMYKRLHPGTTDEQAAEAIESNYTIEHERNVTMRPLQAISGSLGAEAPDASTLATTPAKTPAISPAKPPAEENDNAATR